MELGETISLYRRNRNLTQEELAARLGVTSQAVSKWERRQSLPDVTMLPELCRILEISADSLLGIGENTFSEKRERMTDEEVMRNLRTAENPLAIILGTGIAEAFVKTRYAAFIGNQRRALSSKGILMPLVHITDRRELDENEWMIVAYSRILFREKIENAPEDLGLYTAEILGRIVAENYGYILNRDLVRALVCNLKTEYPTLIEGIVPEKISYALLQDIMCGLWERGHNAALYMIKIIEKTESCLQREPNIGGEELAAAIAEDIERGDNYFKFLETKSGTA
ncbi:MAG: helix-turn-helix domain-containing protein [Butyrivibrio sp.]|nr:helix-turn-helix domain-containing protein [Butyrivibrio sp.]